MNSPTEKPIKEREGIRLKTALAASRPIEINPRPLAVESLVRSYARRTAPDFELSGFIEELRRIDAENSNNHRRL